jgi:hypothetical protein
MSSRGLLVVSSLVFLSLSTVALTLPAQDSERLVGTPTCVILPNGGQPGRSCAHVNCDATGYVFTSSTTCEPTRLEISGKFIARVRAVLAAKLPSELLATLTTGGLNMDVHVHQKTAQSSFSLSNHQELFVR